MLRLIDVVLIILFGIMMVTSIDDQIEVDLVQTRNLLPMPEDTRGYLMIGLSKESTYLFDYGRQVFRAKDRKRMLQIIESERDTMLLLNRQNAVGGEVAEPQVRIWADSLALCGDVELMMELCREADIACGLLTVIEEDRGMENGF